MIRQQHTLNATACPGALWEMSPWERLQLEAGQNTANTCQEEQGVYLLHPHSFSFIRLPLLSHTVLLPQLQTARGGGGGDHDGI